MSDEPEFGTKEHLEWRKKMRLSGKMNPPMKHHQDEQAASPWMRIKLHAFKDPKFCDCEKCVPPDVKEFLKTTSWANRNPKFTKKEYEKRL